jgi:UTP:GlnB (protein PII) uridylyltransferase
MRAPARPALGRLARAGLATALEVRQLRATRPCWRAPLRLHLVAGRREDRLVFDLQTAVAESFGYRRTAPDGRLALRASELLMRRYYWAAKAVTQLNQILLQNIEERLRAERASARAAAAQRALSGARRPARGGRDALYSASRTPSWRPFCSRARRASRACRRARCARCTTRAP